MAANELQRKQVRDIVLSHAHLDHIAGLPLFVDDLFATLEGPIRVHGAREVIDVLENNVFNWSVYPRFSELENVNGPVLEYVPFAPGEPFDLPGLEFTAFSVNHKVPSYGFFISDGVSKILITGDTAEIDGLLERVEGSGELSAIFIECAFPNDMKELAKISHHLTPERLANEIAKIPDRTCPIYCINLKPMYRERIISQLVGLKVQGLEVLDVGRAYEF
jgi:ribonuclease BN (tRNA processing enzyme)